MQCYTKWKQCKQCVNVGDIILLIVNELFNRSWPLARVEQVHPGSDGLVRVVTLKIQKGSYKHAVNRLVPLLMEKEPTTSAPGLRTLLVEQCVD